MYHNKTTEPIIRPILRSNFLGVRFPRNAISENFANVILVMNRKVAAYCAWTLSAVQVMCRLLRLALSKDDNSSGFKVSRCCPRPCEVAIEIKIDCAEADIFSH